MKQSFSRASFNHVQGITFILKVKFLTNVILETSNAVESLHSHMYLAYSLKKGSKRFSILVSRTGPRATIAPDHAPRARGAPRAHVTTATSSK